MFKKIMPFLLVTTILLAACGGATETPTAEPATPSGPRTLTVMTHDSFAVSEDVIAQFEAENDVTVTFLMSGDTGTAVSKAVLAADNPLADVFYGVDNTFLSRALDGDIFAAYDSPALADIPDQFKLDPEKRAIPVDYGDVCLNYEIAYFEENELEPPQSLEDLTEPEYAGLLTVENPATSSPGLAFLFATVGHFGEDGYLDYWQQLVDNDLNVVNDWETAYYSAFSRWGGEYPIVVSYNSSPPVELIYAEEPMDEPVTAVVTAPDTCFRQIEFVGILKGTENRDLAEKWVDFMLSTTFQEDIPLQMFVFPVNSDAELDQTFVDFLEFTEQPVELSPEDITAHRQEWIEAWTETVLR
ncbi:MAG: thiamine ABC transporter substrate-binding protein [Anaerolineales bacterium]|nr:thiamine ABC transporter substrate-binding protein [Anaerolineales bacterium]